MPSEDRYIEFTYEEVYKAIRIRKITENQELPPDGEIARVRFNEKPGEETTITVDLRIAGGGMDYLEFSREFFALALVFYCQGYNIPIPRAGRKEIVTKDDKIIMHISM